jgi:hypothetical protein
MTARGLLTAAGWESEQALRRLRVAAASPREAALRRPQRQLRAARLPHDRGDASVSCARRDGWTSSRASAPRQVDVRAQPGDAAVCRRTTTRAVAVGGAARARPALSGSPSPASSSADLQRRRPIGRCLKPRTLSERAWASHQLDTQLCGERVGALPDRREFCVRQRRRRRGAARDRVAERRKAK